MELWAWGSNNYGQLGLGHANEQYEEPVQVRSEKLDLLYDLSHLTKVFLSFIFLSKKQPLIRVQNGFSSILTPLFRFTYLIRFS